MAHHLIILVRDARVKVAMSQYRYSGEWSTTEGNVQETLCVCSTVCVCVCVQLCVCVCVCVCSTVSVFVCV